MSCVISLRSVTKRFGAITAVNEVSLDFREREFLILLGPSGCGKTTLLRIVAGFEKPDEGMILLDGKDISRLPPNRRPLNLMFQSYALFPHMSVRKNIAYGLEMEKLPSREINRRVDEILEMTRLESLDRRNPGNLSGGQRQRVALARALIKRPRVLLLDEPLSALDKKLREHMQLELKRIQHDLGIAFVVVTHDQEEALVMADRVALFNEGSLVQLDSPENLYEYPTNRFAAQFIGVVNIFEGATIESGIGIPGLGEFVVPSDKPPGLEATLSVRPERFEVSVATPVDGCNAIKGTVADFAYRGQHLDLILDVETVKNQLTVRIPVSEAIGDYSVGQDLWCNWRPEHGRLLVD